MSWRFWRWLLAFGLPLCLSGFASAKSTELATPLHYPAVEALLDVQSLDLYPEEAKIHALIAGRFVGHNRPRLAYLVSADGGAAWSKPVFLDQDDDAPVTSRRGNDAQIAAHGAHLVAVWQERGALPGSGPMRLAYSEDFGHSWKPAAPPPIDDPTNTQSYPDLAADGRGHFHLVWLDDREENGNTQGLRYANSSNGGRQWTNQTTVDGSVCTCCWNRVGVLPDGAVAVLYRDADPHDMRLATRHPVGPWRTLGAVGKFDWHFSGCPHCGGGIASTTGAGDAVLHSVVWTGAERAPGLYYLYSKNAGETWSAPAALGDSQSREPDIAAVSPAHLAIVYGAEQDGAHRIQLRQSRDGGRTWTTPVPLSGQHTRADHPRVLATPFGLRAFWTERRADGGRTWAMQSL